jgi:hypothetical protein
MRTKLALAVAGCAAAVVSAAPTAGAADVGPDIEASITGPAGPVKGGSKVTYTATVTNHGPGAAPGTVAMIAVDGQARVNSATPSSGTCAPNKLVKGYRCSLGSIAQGASVTVTVVATVQRKPGTTRAYVQAAHELGNDANGMNNEAWTATTVG